MNWGGVSFRATPKRHRTIEPDADFGLAPALQIATKVGWDLDSNLQRATAEPLLHLGVMRHGRLLAEVTRTGKLLQICMALWRVVPIKNGVGSSVLLVLYGARRAVT